MNRTKGPELLNITGIARSRDNKHQRISNLKGLSFNYFARERALFLHE